MALWDKVWSLDVPSKAKHLLCRISQGLLPQYKCIRRTEVASDVSCFSYDGKDEDVTHTLFKCEYARAVWFGSPLSIRVEDMINFESSSKSVSDLCNKLDDNTLALWAMLAWGLWFNRNTRCQGKQGFDPIELIEKVLEELNGFQKRNKDVEMVNAEKGSWVAPPTRWVKINCHVSHIYSGGVGMGCVIRDDMGEVVGSFVNRLDLKKRKRTRKDAQETAVYESLLFGLKMGFRQIIIESDCKAVVRKFQSIEWETSKDADNVEKSIKVGPKDYDFSVYYIRRDENLLAKSIAEFALQVDAFTVWIEELPPNVINFDRFDVV